MSDSDFFGAYLALRLERILRNANGVNADSLHRVRVLSVEGRESATYFLWVFDSGPCLAILIPREAAEPKPTSLRPRMRRGVDLIASPCSGPAGRLVSSDLTFRRPPTCAAGRPTFTPGLMLDCGQGVRVVTRHYSSGRTSDFSLHRPVLLATLNW